MSGQITDATAEPAPDQRKPNRRAMSECAGLGRQTVNYIQISIAMNSHSNSTGVFRRNVDVIRRRSAAKPRKRWLITSVSMSLPNPLAA